LEEALTPADGNPLEDEVAGLLLEASFDLLARGGWGNFSLRAVADSIGAAGSAASHRFGDRAGLVAAVCDAAIDREGDEMARFLPGIQVGAGDELAAALYEWLEQRVECNRRQARVCSELLLVSYREPAFHTFSGRWVETCRGMVARLAPSFDDEASRAVAGFLAVEIAYWLLLADDPLFRLASGEALRRIVMVAQGSTDPLPVFWLRRGLDLPDARRPVQLTGTKQRIIEATTRIILDSGVQAVTHREIAKRSGASLSSLTYHFESLDDLIRNGFQMLFSTGTGRPVPAMPHRAVACYEMVVQALRDPFLAPLAATLRRHLGCELFGDVVRSDDPQVWARCEAEAVMRTALVLTGGGRCGGISAVA
jgi:AcrR family transcriptional regulator